MNFQTRLNYIVNWLAFFDVAALMLSGLMISQEVMPVLGITLPENFAWRRLHELTANLFMILLGVHTALHWNWIVTSCGKYIFQPIGRIVSLTSKKDTIA